MSGLICGWVPTGLLQPFVASAAGMHRPSLRNEAVMDRAMSSYATSVKTFGFAPAGCPQATSPGNVLVGCMDRRPVFLFCSCCGGRSTDSPDAIRSVDVDGGQHVSRTRCWHPARYPGAHPILFRISLCRHGLSYQGSLKDHAALIVNDLTELTESDILGLRLRPCTGSSAICRPATAPRSRIENLDEPIHLCCAFPGCRLPTYNRRPGSIVNDAFCVEVGAKLHSAL